MFCSILDLAGFCTSADRILLVKPSPEISGINSFFLGQYLLGHPVLEHQSSRQLKKSLLNSLRLLGMLALNSGLGKL